MRDGPRPLLEGHLALYSGESEHAREILADGVVRMREAGARASLCHYLFALARVELANDKLLRAESILREGAEIASASHAQFFEILFRPELVSLYARINRPADARVNLERCVEIMPAGEDWFGLAGHVARAQGEFAASQGDWVAAAGSLDRAILNFREYRYRGRKPARWRRGRGWPPRNTIARLLSRM